MSDRQPTRSKRENVDPNRKFDKTSLHETAHGTWIHRDYGAHYFRWGFTGRFVTNATEVLDVGCGPEFALVKALTMPRNTVPKCYVGVDMNKAPRKPIVRQWSEYHWEFDFTARFKELKQKFDLITNFEVIEHMHKEDGEKLLAAMRACLKPDGMILLSTPVFNGHAAANHLHEWEIPELDAAIHRAKLKTVRRFGTFAQLPKIRKAATPEDWSVYKRLSEYYGAEVMACFLAPLYPDVSSNNVWMIKHV